jgi:hypothetical protein
MLKLLEVKRKLGAKKKNLHKKTKNSGVLEKFEIAANFRQIAVDFC